MKKYHPIDKQYALSIAKELQRQLQEKNVPVLEVLIFGSAAKGETHAWSDIDIAVVSDPFLPAQFDEQHTCSRLARTIDVRAEVVCLHPEDFENKYFTLAQEVKRHGVAV